MTFYSFLFSFSFFTFNHPSSHIVSFSNSHYFFQPIADLHLSILQNDTFSRLSLPYPHESKSSKTRNAVLETLLFQNSHFRKVRLTFFSSEDKQMFQSVWYPQENKEAPILTMDFVHFEKNKSLVFVNLIETENHVTNLSSFMDIKEKYPLFSTKINRRLIPFNGFISDAFLYAHLYDDFLVKKQLSDIVEQYLLNYFDLFSEIDPFLGVNYKKQKEYNRIRKVVDASFVLKDYFDPKWYAEWLEYIYQNDDF